ncbi:MAG: hypothetical protein QX192_04875 [Methylococcales bacterium]
MRIKPLSLLIGSMLATSMLPNYAVAKSFAAKSSVSGVNVLAELEVAQNDDGLAGQTFLAVELNGQFYFFNGSKWQAYQAGQTPAPYYSGTLAKRMITVSELNSQPYAGARLYIGHECFP